MIALKQMADRVLLFQDGIGLGMAMLYDNPYHKNNCYIKLELKQLDTESSAELFQKLRQMAKRPLQVMVNSDHTALTEFLVAGGFQCRRKCYEVEASTADYVGEKTDTGLLLHRKGEMEYEQCCRMMFDHYIQTHQAVNPWTAGFQRFCDELPETVACTKRNGEITSLAFLEENEIAYVCGTGELNFSAFVHSLVTYLLDSYETIFFESDDCDWAAMQMKALFANQSEVSYDTYILE